MWRNLRLWPECFGHRRDDFFVKHVEDASSNAEHSFFEGGGGRVRRSQVDAKLHRFCKLSVSHNKIYNSKLIRVMQKCSAECISKFRRRT